MRSLWPSLVAACCLVSRAGVAQDSLPEPLRQARALIAAGKTEDAVRLAERYTGDRARDPRGFVVLGDAYFQRMPTGRFLALRAYREAERLAPRDPEPPYKVAQAGLWLGGDDGEAMAQQGLERVLELDPLYASAWDQWLTLFRNSGSRRRMAARLAPHRDYPVIRSRLALLAIEDERYDTADALLNSAIATDSTNPAWLALRAQSAFEANDTLSGWAFYLRALAHADRDSTDVLWRQAVGIAWPSEIRAWGTGVPARQKQGWIESFWARRNPDLFAGVNHRVAEHFTRLRYAQKHYQLLHPLISYHRSQIARAMNLEPSAGERAYNLVCEMYEVLIPYHPPAGPRQDLRAAPGSVATHPFDDQDWLATQGGVPMPGVSHARDRARVSPSPFAAVQAQAIMEGIRLGAGIEAALFAPMNLDLRSADSVAARIGYNLATGLDDRGVMYLRFGAPDAAFVGGNNASNTNCASPDVERWRYAEWGEVRFARPSAFSRGERTVPDMVFRAMNDRQFEAVQTGLTIDATSEPAPLDFGVWTAQFANIADPRATDLVVVSTRGAVAASLTGPTSAGGARADSSGVVTVSAAPGRYVLLAQAEDSGKLGRQTLQIGLKRFDSLPAVSELLLAPAWSDPAPSRDAMIARVERTLVFLQGAPIRSYAEVYGLHAMGGIVRYRVEYDLLKTSAPQRDIGRQAWPEAIRFEFERQRPGASIRSVSEMLDITPDRTPPGNYLLRLRVEDLVEPRSAGQATISFVVR